MPINKQILEFAGIIKDLLGCDAVWLESVAVKETFSGETAWEGTVEVFKLQGHPTATRCYAWASPMDSGKDRIYAVLDLPPVDSPASAVRASIIQDRREGRI